MASHPWREWVEAMAATTPEEMARVGQRMPGGHSRWSAGKDLSWEPLRIERVCEVKYDHMQGDRFRHAATFLRWRDDKAPEDCRYDQLEVTPAYELAAVFGASRDSRNLLRSSVSPGIRDRRQLRLLGSQFLGHVLQVDANPPPARRSPAHGIGQDVGGLKVLDDVRVLCLPSFQRLQCFLLFRRVRDDDQRMLGHTPAGPGGLGLGSWVLGPVPSAVEATPSWGCLPLLARDG